MIPPLQVASDGQIISGALSIGSAILAWITSDWSMAIFGVRLSIVLAGFAGAMCVLSFLPKFDSRSAMWGAVAVSTIAASYLTKLVLKVVGWDSDLAPGIGFVIGFTFQSVGTWVVSGKWLDAILAKFSGR